jgi:PPOX class probable F420-dependent enzyme
MDAYGARVELSAEETEFLARNHAAAMITIGRDGTPRPVRVGVAVVDGRVCSSGTATRVRTRRLRRDPRCSLFVFDQHGYAWLALDTTVTIHDGADAAARNLRLFRVMQDRPNGPLLWYGQELNEQQFLAAMDAEHRLIYEFEVHRSYGLPPAA